MRNKSGAIYLTLAILFEVFATTNLKLSDGFSHLSYSVTAVLGVFGSIFFLGKSLDRLPLSIAYAIWVGLGTSLITLIGAFVFDETFGVTEMLGILLVIGGVAALNYHSKDRYKGNNKKKMQKRAVK